MNYFDKKQTDRIEKLEKKLYSKTTPLDGDVRSELERRPVEADPDWRDGDLLEQNTPGQALPTKPHTGIFFVILLIALIFFVGALGYAAYVFIGGGQVVSNDDIDISIVGPVSVGGGDKLSVDVVVQNNSPTILEAANLVITYPEGTKTVDLKEDVRRGLIDIGDVAVGQVVKETLDMAFLGENGDTKSVDVKVEYRIPGSTVLFNKTKTFTVTLSVAPVQILVGAVEQVPAGQSFDITLDIRSNSERPINNLLVVAEYPFGFKYEGASVQPTYGNNVWEFGTFNPTDAKSIVITGQIQAQDKEQRAFRFSAGNPRSDNREEIGVTLTNTRHVVSIERPFIGLELVIDDSSEPVVAVESGEPINADVVFSNNTNNLVRDVAITLFLEGAALDKKGVNISGGFYSSFDNKVTYDKTTNADLAQVTPRQQVLLTNILETLDLSVNNRNLINAEIRISATVTGRRVSETGVEEQIEEKDFVTLKILSDLVFKSTAAHHITASPSTGFLDSGPVPPRVDQETSYTVTWSLANSVNDLENVRVVGIVPSYVTWKPGVSPGDENLTYDPNTRRLIWDVGNVSAGVGHSVPNRKVTFQVVLRPSISQVQQTPVLVDNISLSAFDTFTKQKIEGAGTDTLPIIEGRDSSDLHHYVIQ